jgi:nicotinamide-nucleotide amidase
MIGILQDFKELDPALAQLKQIMKKQKLTLAVAESVTAGFIQFIMSNLPDATDIYQGGITAYNCAQKAKHLGVEPIYAEKNIGVHPCISHRMAKSVSAMFNAQIGIGITGFAEPVDEENKDIEAYLSVVLEGRELLMEHLVSEKDTFSERQVDFACQAIHLLVDTLSNYFD